MICLSVYSLLIEHSSSNTMHVAPNAERIHAIMTSLLLHHDPGASVPDSNEALQEALRQYGIKTRIEVNDVWFDSTKEVAAELSMSMEKRQPLRQVLTDILIQHQCMSDSGCSCGQVRLGASYADHVAGKLLPAIEEHIAMAQERGLLEPSATLITKLKWESAGTDEPGDQNAGSKLVAHGYWSLGPNGKDLWSVQLIEQNEYLHEVPAGGIDLGSFPTESGAKEAAEKYEAGGIRTWEG